MKLEVGKYYKNYNGKVVKIINYYEGRPFPYFDGEESYLETGRYFNCGTSPYDLIEEVIPVPAYRVKAEQTDKRDFIKSMEGEKGKVYTEFSILPDDYEKFIYMGWWSYYATQVDAGYIDPITGEFVMNENESKKLKLEVGKTYRDGYGDLHKIVNNGSNSAYPEHTFWSEERSYTVEGFWQMEKKDHKYNLLEEVEVEAETRKTTTKKEQPVTTKYYRTTEKNTETKMPIGSIVTLHEDDGTRQPAYKDVNTGEIQCLVTDRLEEINVKTVKTVISPASKLVKILEDSGYEVCDDGEWFKDESISFAPEMFYFCDKTPTDEWNWLPEWLEEKVVFDSTVNTFNARQFIVDFMKKKRELSHEAYLYQRDIDEIENEWSDEECEKVAGRILAQRYLGFGSPSCPFCIKFADSCDDCSYGRRHGVCGKGGADYAKYVLPTVGSNARPELLDFVDNYPGAW